MAVGLVYDPCFLEHREPPGHPERAARLRACVDALQREGLLERFERVEASRATPDVLARCHEPGYVEAVCQLEGQRGHIDGDTYVSEGSIDAALRAAGGATALAEAVLDGRLAAGLALVRPPGHHAEVGSAGGFCLFGNAALAAAAARERGLRASVLDFDVHHGNGTQAIFYDSADVQLVSMHRYGFGYYPGSGAREERGRGAGEGTTLNVPLAARTDGAQFLAAYDEHAAPALEAFGADLLVVSAGFDAHVDDPLGGLRVDDASYAELARRLVALAGRVCAGRVVFVLEGGYDLDGLAAGIVSVARALLA